MHIMNERNKLAKEKYKMYHLRIGAPGSVIGLNPVLKEIKNVKNSLMLNGIKEGVIRAKLHPTRFPTYGKELKA